MGELNFMEKKDSKQASPEKTAAQNSETQKISLRTAVRNIIAGVVVGVANVIPGVSGGTMAVSMGVYDELMESLSSKWKKHIYFLITLAVGAVAGILVFSNLATHLVTNINAKYKKGSKSALPSESLVNNSDGVQTRNYYRWREEENNAVKYSLVFCRTGCYDNNAHILETEYTK